MNNQEKEKGNELKRIRKENKWMRVCCADPLRQGGGFGGFPTASGGVPGSMTYRNEDLDEIYKMEEDSGGKNPRNRAKRGRKEEIPTR